MLTSTNSQSTYSLDDRHFSQLCELVYTHTGIQLTDAKRELVHRRFSPRLKKLQLNDFGEYLALVKSGDKDEIVEFSNAITTNLTSFFRENHHFDFLRDEFFPMLREKNALSKKIRIWSAGCSTGPEPYSLAIVLREAIPDIDRWDAKILATDLDTNCVATSAQGNYTQKVVETVSEARLNRWFSQSDNGREKIYTAKDELKSLITFNPLNLLKPFPFKGKFDVIICRNVFIYFDKPTQKTIISKFAAHQEANDCL
ncbi:MAG: protein-glutamate O-methyltransferase CheR, partial [Pseudohongiellaceae bacterium]